MNPSPFFAELKRRRVSHTGSTPADREAPVA
jgi:hypothetical protein